MIICTRFHIGQKVAFLNVPFHAIKYAIILEARAHVHDHGQTPNSVYQDPKQPKAVTCDVLYVLKPVVSATDVTAFETFELPESRVYANARDLAECLRQEADDPTGAPKDEHPFGHP